MLSCQWKKCPVSVGAGPFISRPRNHYLYRLFDNFLYKKYILGNIKKNLKEGNLKGGKNTEGILEYIDKNSSSFGVKYIFRSFFHTIYIKLNDKDVI